jgi:putative pyruvate formate lyase activating enzyme
MFEKSEIAKTEPGYLVLYRNGRLQKIADEMYNSISECKVCPRNCKVNRFKNDNGFCRSGSLPVVSSYCVHFGEEPPLVADRGVGNIFLGNCNLRCVYCQNYQISQNYDNEKKNEVSFERIAEIMIELQEQNVTSIGFVSPTHYVPHILKALVIAVEKGLHLPLIYNSNGYDSVDTLKQIAGIFDIYLPDFKYGDSELAAEYSSAKDYFITAANAIVEMYKQVGSKLCFNEDGLLTRGLIIRHLVLPNNISETFLVFEELKNKIGNEVCLSVMSQYYPVFKAEEKTLISRPLRESEYNKVLDALEKLGFENGWLQDYESKHIYRPDFNNRISPFKKNE